MNREQFEKRLPASWAIVNWPDGSRPEARYSAARENGTLQSSLDPEKLLAKCLNYESFQASHFPPAAPAPRPKVKKDLGVVDA